MKKVVFSSLFLFVLLLSCKENNEIKNSEIIKKEESEIDQLFALKNEITKTEQLNFISNFYALTVVDTMLNKDKTLNKSELTKVIKQLVKDGGLSGTQINENQLNEILKKSKTKYELANAIYEDFEKGLTGDGLITYDIEKLTDNIFKIYQKDRASMGGSDLLYKYENGKYLPIEKEKLEKLVSPGLIAISQKLKRKFERQNGKYQTYDSTIIENEQYMTVPYYEVIPGDDCSGCAFKYNLLIATNLINGKFYYIYDDPKNKNDDWKNDSEYNEHGATVVTEKKPKWIKIE